MNEELPHAPHAEAAVLAAIIESPLRFWPLAVEAMLEIDHFHMPENRALWEIMASRCRSGLHIDPVSIREEILALKSERLTLESFSSVLLSELQDGAWVDHIEILRDRMARRIAILTGRLVESGEVSGEEALKSLRMASERAASILAGSSAVIHARTAVRAFVDALEERQKSGIMPGTPTGISQIDHVTGGMRSGQLWVVAGKPSKGKSALLLQIANGAIMEGKRVLVFTLEMSRDEVIGRLVACHGRIDVGEIMGTKAISAASLPKIARSAKEFADSSLMICDKGTITIDEISAHSQRIADTHGLDLVVIDYLQLVTAVRVKGQNREQEVASISRASKQLAKRLGCPVLTGSQLNEAGQTRESRAIEQDADVLFSIVNSEDFNGLLAWKVRNGERNTKIPGVLNGEIQRFIFN